MHLPDTDRGNMAVMPIHGRLGQEGHDPGQHTKTVKNIYYHEGLILKFTEKYKGKPKSSGGRGGGGLEGEGRCRTYTWQTYPNQMVWWQKVPNSKVPGQPELREKVAKK